MWKSRSFRPRLIALCGLVGLFLISVFSISGVAVAAPAAHALQTAATPVGQQDVQIEVQADSTPFYLASQAAVDLKQNQITLHEPITPNSQKYWNWYYQQTAHTFLIRVWRETSSPTQPPFVAEEIGLTGALITHISETFNGSVRTVDEQITLHSSTAMKIAYGLTAATLPSPFVGVEQFSTLIATLQNANGQSLQIGPRQVQFQDKTAVALKTIVDTASPTLAQWLVKAPILSSVAFQMYNTQGTLLATLTFQSSMLADLVQSDVASNPFDTETLSLLLGTEPKIMLA